MDLFQLCEGAGWQPPKALCKAKKACCPGRSAGAGGGAADGGVGVDEFADGTLLAPPLKVVGYGDVGGTEVDAHVLYI